MPNLYTPESLGIKAPSGGFKEGGWYAGRQYFGGQLSDPGVINPLSSQQGAGQAVSAEVNAQSAAAQGKTPQQLEAYLQAERDKQAKSGVVPSSQAVPSAGQPGSLDLNGGAGTGLGLGVGTPAPVLNLPELYKSLYETQGISALETSLNEKAKGYADAQSKINDNPFLAEASRTGRIAKLTNDYNASVKNDQDLLAMKKQDIATQLDIATKQFDINSQTSKAALDQFNTLLQSGALAGASGTDIASLTASTGMSSGMIQSAIKAQNKKDAKVNVTTVDDGKNIYSVAIDSATGELVNKQVISASKPSAPKEASASERELYYKNALVRDASNSANTLDKIFQIYSPYLDAQTILYLYNSNSANPSTDYKSLEKYGIKDPNKLSPTEQMLVNLGGASAPQPTPTR